jgi:hypothetical protein
MFIDLLIIFVSYIGIGLFSAMAWNFYYGFDSDWGIQSFYDFLAMILCWPIVLILVISDLYESIRSRKKK